jgi:hypothetical protein
MLNKQAVSRLSEVNLTGPEIVKIFETLAEMLENQPAEQVAWTVGYTKDEDLKLGEFVPTINFVLTRHNPQELVEDE